MAKSFPSSRSSRNKCPFPPRSCRYRTADLDHEIVFRTQNELCNQSSTVDPHDDEIDLNRQFLSFKYDGILLRHDLDGRILRTRELLKVFPTSLPADETQDASVREDLREKLRSVCDAFERLETARRTEAIRLLEEKKHFQQVKRNFLQTRTDLLNNIALAVHLATTRYAKEYEELDRHRSFLEKEIENIKPKIDIAERINNALNAKVSFVQNYGPMIDEKLRAEEAELAQMRSQKASLESKIEEMGSAVEEVLVKQDAARLEIQVRKNDLISRLEDKLQLLAIHRDERQDRRKHPIQHQRDFLRAQCDELRPRVEEFRRLNAEVSHLVAQNKIETDLTLLNLKTEHAKQEAELPILTKEQLREKLLKQKARREKKERDRLEKELRKKQALERNFERMRAQMKEADDHLKAQQNLN
ncbi:hypothetical protein BV898_05662 [Hypsibius exemplaris]|uniref:Uncharacterized protein n=1 Tax=Hypsibius exemplaris TaxID=2072580 RepID=A0A1W0WYY6_HYPEX|nr:hypothetical protein BV898_05662 [Hypsibius exemplaris]